MSSDLLPTAHRYRFLRDQAEVRAFEGALAEYASQMSPDDLPALYAMFEDDTIQHEVMFGLVHLIDRFPASAALSAFVDALPAMMSHAYEWARTIMARSVNDAEASELLTRLLSSASQENGSAARRLLTELASRKPKLVGVRAEAMLASLSA